MVTIKEIKIDIWKEYVPMYVGTRYCLNIEVFNDDGSRYTFNPTLTYGGKWEDHTTFETNLINNAYNGNEEEVRKIGTEILKNRALLVEKHLLTREMSERINDFGTLLRRYIIR